MKVIICGAGQVGFNIARYLASENADVTVIDQSRELIEKITDSLDVQGLVGFASQPAVQESAVARDPEMVIAVNAAAEDNMSACPFYHASFEVQHKNATVRPPSHQLPL